MSEPRTEAGRTSADSIPPDPLRDLVQAHRLTETLRRAGVLSDAVVDNVAVESSRTTALSQIVRLRLSYDGHAPTAPASIIFKTSRPDRAASGWTAGRHEVEYYTKVASSTSGGLVPRCFEAQCDDEAKTWHLLLEDLSGTHFIAQDWPLPPAIGLCESIVDAHARRQALSWDAPHLEPLMESWRWRDKASADQHIERLAAQIATFGDQLGDRLPPSRRTLYSKLLDAAPRLTERYRRRRHLTVVQGDAHVWNCFMPNDGGHDVRFFDWDSWRIDVGAGDLAYMMAVHWYPDRRHRYETALLDRYHARLLAQGVQGYDRCALSDDYRFCTLWLMTWPVMQQAYGIAPMIWWNNMERVMMAVDDLDCLELLSG